VTSCKTCGISSFAPQSNSQFDENTGRGGDEEPAWPLYALQPGLAVFEESPRPLYFKKLLNIGNLVILLLYLNSCIAV
jgi:hypothetical protein